MSQFRAAARFLLRDDTAATMVEYALMLALVALVCFLAVQLLGTATNSVFTDAAAKVGEAGS